jgi:Ca2+-binding EF-hand superfamily protein
MDGAIEKNPAAFQSLLMPNKRADYTFDIGKHRPKPTRMRLVKETPSIKLGRLKPISLRPHRNTLAPMDDGRVFVTKDGLTLMPGQKLPGFRYVLPKDKAQSRYADIRQFFMTCKEQFGGLEDFAFMYDKQGNCFNYLDEVSATTKTLLVSPHPHFSGIKLVQAKSLFHDSSEDEVQLPFKSSRLSTRQAQKSQRVRSQASIATSSYDDIGLERLTRHLPFVSGLEGNFDQLPESKLSYRASTSPEAVKPPKKKKRRLRSSSPDFKVDYVKANVAKVRTGGSVTTLFEKQLPPLSQMDIPGLMQKYNFTRVELHHLYAQYKSMLMSAYASDPEYSEDYTELREGVNKDTFTALSRNASSVFGKELTAKVFEVIDQDHNGTAHSGFIDWEEYLAAMSIVNVGTNETKIDLFFKVNPSQIYDKNKNGRLNYAEVKDLCKLQIKPSDEAFLEEMGEFLAQSLFRVAGVPEDQEMEADQLKQGLLRDAESRSMVELFCCWENRL